MYFGFLHARHLPKGDRNAVGDDSHHVICVQCNMHISQGRKIDTSNIIVHLNQMLGSDSSDDVSSATPTHEWAGHELNEKQEEEEKFPTCFFFLNIIQQRTFVPASLGSTL